MTVKSLEPPPLLAKPPLLEPLRLSRTWTSPEEEEEDEDQDQDQDQDQGAGGGGEGGEGEGEREEEGEREDRQDREPEEQQGGEPNQSNTTTANSNNAHPTPNPHPSPQPPAPHRRHRRLTVLANPLSSSSPPSLSLLPIHIDPPPPTLLPSLNPSQSSSNLNSFSLNHLTLSPRLSNNDLQPRSPIDQHRKRRNLSEFYNQHKQRLHSFLPKSNQNQQKQKQKGQHQPPHQHQHQPQPQHQHQSQDTHQQPSTNTALSILTSQLSPTSSSSPSPLPSPSPSSSPSLPSSSPSPSDPNSNLISNSNPTTLKPTEQDHQSNPTSQPSSAKRTIPTQPTHHLLPPPSSSSSSSSSSLKLDLPPIPDAVNPDFKLKDGPLLRAQLSNLEHRALQLKKSIKPLIKAFEHYHDSISIILECDDRLETALRTLDETAPACFKPLKDAYYESAKNQLRMVDQEHKHRLEYQVLDPLRRMWNQFKEIPHRKKVLLQHLKLYDEALQKYLSLKSEAQPEKQRMEEMEARLEYSRTYYHHWIYELAVFQEVEVLEILTEYMSSHHSTRGSSIGLDPQIVLGLENLRKQLIVRRLERDAQKFAMDDHRTRLLERLDQLIEPGHPTQPIDSPNHSTLTQAPRSTGLTRSSSTLEHSNYSTSNLQHRTHEIGGKLRGFALTLTGKAFGHDESHNNSSTATTPTTNTTPLPRHQRKATIANSLGLLPHSIHRSPIRSDDRAIPQQDNQPPPTHPVDDQLRTIKRVRSWSENVQRNKEGFLLSCTKSLAAGAPNRNTSPNDHSQQGTGGISSGEASRSWKKLWCVLAGGELREYKGDELIEPNRSSIDLRYAMVRQRKGKTERKFCFEVVTTQFVRVYQAFSHDEMANWIAAIEVSIENALNTRPAAVKTSDQPKVQAGGAAERSRLANLSIPKFKPSHRVIKEETNHSTTRKLSLPINQSATHLDIRRSSDHPSYANLRIEWNSKTSTGSLFDRKSYDRASQSSSFNHKHSISNSKTGEIDLMSDWNFDSQPKTNDPVHREERFEEDLSILSNPANYRLDLSVSGPMAKERKDPMTTNTENSKSSSNSHPIIDQRNDRFLKGNQHLISISHGDASYFSDSGLGLDSKDEAKVESKGKGIDDDFTNRDEKKQKEEELEDGMIERNWKELDRLSKVTTCAECGTSKPRWSSYSLGILICIKCSGIHRGLGTHISKVRSLDLDDWNDEQIKLIKSIGNSKSNQIWEAKLPVNFNRFDSNLDLKQFIYDKYVLKKFM